MRRSEITRIFYQDIQQGSTLTSTIDNNIRDNLDAGREVVASFKFDGDSTTWNGSSGSLGNGVMWSEGAAIYDNPSAPAGMTIQRRNDIYALLDTWAAKALDFTNDHGGKQIWCLHHEPNATDDYKLGVLNPGGTSRSVCGLNLAKSTLLVKSRFALAGNNVHPVTGNVRFAPIWIPDHFAFTTAELANWWPAAFTTEMAFVGVDPYNWGPCKSDGSQWRSFNYKTEGNFGVLTFAKAKGKQLLVGEWATTEDDGIDEVGIPTGTNTLEADGFLHCPAWDTNPYGESRTRKAEYFNDMVTLFKTAFWNGFGGDPEASWVYAISHWESNKDHPFWHDTRPESAQAFRLMALDDIFNDTAQALPEPTFGRIPLPR